ncbi:hypothetical protein T4A_14414 [Trichinella pseudospiralis]|uniref:Uncharacterized protein n=1 Tax=Trichinella pseudospiralis TaxID=6337 RepID=A0A0V1DVN4_TRIPS|nr:hypothetical protein T4A_14414 [Trichinella pseudospiralis]
MDAHVGKTTANGVRRVNNGVSNAMTDKEYS